MKKIFLFVLIISAVLMISCKNDFVNDELKESLRKENLIEQQTTVFIDFNSSARTVLPEFEVSKLKNIVLKGSNNGGEQKTLASFESVSVIKSVGIDLGTWDFILTAQQENTTFSGNLTQTINEGENTLSFTLEVRSYGNVEDKGSVNVTLSFPQNVGVKTIKAGLFDVIEQTEVITGFETETLSFASGKVVYKKTSVPVGTYFLKYDFYADAECTIFMNSYKEIVVIASGCESSAERTIDSLNEVYEITYELNGGEFKEGFTAPVSFTRHSTVTLPTENQIIKGKYYFDGFYENEDFSGEVLTEFSNCTESKVLYARWIINISNSEINTLDLSWINDEYTIVLKDYISSSGFEKLLNKINEIAFLVNLDFSYCSSLFSVSEIKYSFFKDCDNLKSIILPESITSIGDNAFNSCKNLESITIPNTVTSIGFKAFCSCEKLEKITIPEHIKIINGYTFSYCSSLTSIIIPNSVTVIDYNSFEYCTSLNSITIPDSIEFINIWAFDHCTSLKNIFYEGTVSQWCNINIDEYGPGPFVNSDMNFYIQNKLIENIVLDSTVTKIPNYAFYYCKSLKTVVISYSVVEIGKEAFYGCSKLESVEFRDSKNWYTSVKSDYKNGSLRDVQDVSSNAKNLRYNLASCYWHKE